MENTKIKIAAQTYNLWRTPLNVLGKLQVIKTLGYDSVELAGFNGETYEGVAAEDLKEEIKRLDIDICGAHIPYKNFETYMDNIIAYHQKLGVHWVAIPRPVVESKADMNALIANIQKYAGQLRSAGLDLYYHCHDFEFKAFEGQTTMERILSETDVMIEVDVFWAAKGGCDVKQFLKDHADRIIYLHMKDTDDEDNSCAVGDGHADCAAYCQMAKEMGLTHIVVEDDLQKPDGITSICRSIHALKKMM